jgi:ADP-heptose:LPS heptosyltransferase
MKENKSKILIIRKYGNMGDLLMMTPALECLAKDNILDIVILKEYREVFMNLPFINNVLFLDEIPKFEEYDEVINLSDFEFNYEQIHQPEITKTKIELFACALNVLIIKKKPIIRLLDSEIEWAKSFIKNLKYKKTILLTPRSKDITRDWPLEKWKVLFDLLKKQEFNILSVDKNLVWEDKDIIFLNSLSIRQLFALISQVDLLVTPDSGALHIGAAFNIKTIVIFGPTDFRMRTYDNCYEIHKNTGCYPCWYRRCNNLYCLKLINVNEVYEKIMDVIKNE